MKLFPPMYIFNLYNMITYNRVTFNTIIPLIPKHFKKKHNQFIKRKGNI